MKIHFSIAKNKKAKDVSAKLLNLYGQVELEKADIIVAVGGDGAMLAAMRESINYNIPVAKLSISRKIVCEFTCVAHVFLLA